MSTGPQRTAILLAHCPDQRGLVAAVGDFVARHGGNIVYFDQHVDDSQGVFFMRVEWALDGFSIAPEAIGGTFADEIAGHYGMTWRLHFSDERPRLALFVSRLPHCLYDLLSRWQGGEWAVDIPLIVSNHEDLRPVAERFGIDYHCLPITPENKAAQEARELELLRAHEIDLVVLARYMQIVGPALIGAYRERLINIHHSFLPAFAGARPYHAAHARGVKIIGATSHYVTEELDAGPIIAQDVTPVTHRDDVDELVRKGRDLERLVLAQAVHAHLQRKILSYGNRTVIFD
ncbi:Formyltetrahydrofolate deformylase [wastewater metagenome]|uniref:Formyltetrahydrofolate deformylase n=2 Tax=unclassified sequences TaxID=12908 RepID=A0A5B8RL28_9ZZZZ|nr:MULTISPECIES: formyltetrahydrofolate deformylase [Arhodomonas]MCS4504900.1 formyltetrahydrofolate deformylase [Arhodomonas aquaeolei]QEA07727.1 formyltetrahydrofolate deformylase [uncultured organism]